MPSPDSIPTQILQPEDGRPPTPDEPRDPEHLPECDTKYRGCSPDCTFHYDWVVSEAVRGAQYQAERAAAVVHTARKELEEQRLALGVWIADLRADRDVSILGLVKIFEDLGDLKRYLLVGLEGVPDVAG